MHWHIVELWISNYSRNVTRITDVLKLNQMELVDTSPDRETVTFRLGVSNVAKSISMQAAESEIRNATRSICATNIIMITKEPPNQFKYRDMWLDPESDYRRKRMIGRVIYRLRGSLNSIRVHLPIRDRAPSLGETDGDDQIYALASTVMQSARSRETTWVFNRPAFPNEYTGPLKRRSDILIAVATLLLFVMTFLTPFSLALWQITAWPWVSAGIVLLGSAGLAFCLGGKNNKDRRVGWWPRFAMLSMASGLTIFMGWAARNNAPDPAGLRIQVIVIIIMIPVAVAILGLLFFPWKSMQNQNILPILTYAIPTLGILIYVVNALWGIAAQTIGMPLARLDLDILSSIEMGVLPFFIFLLIAAIMGGLSGWAYYYRSLGPSVWGHIILAIFGVFMFGLTSFLILGNREMNRIHDISNHWNDADSPYYDQSYINYNGLVLKKVCMRAAEPESIVAYGNFPQNEAVLLIPSNDDFYWFLPGKESSDGSNFASSVPRTSVQVVAYDTGSKACEKFS